MTDLTTPNTAANGGQIPDWRERMQAYYAQDFSRSIKPSSYFMEKENADLRAYVAGLIVGTESLNATIADLRAALAAPAIPKVDRNAVLEETVDAPKLSVWYGAMPESNGKSNFTAILHADDIEHGITLDRSEYPDRVRYEADCARHLIGELKERPFLLDYDADKRSDYVAPEVAQPSIPKYLPPPELTWLYTHCRAIGMTCKSDSGKWEHDIALFTMSLQNEIRAAKDAAQPAAQVAVRRATAELTLPELVEEFRAVAELGCDYTISAGACAKLYSAMTTGKPQLCFGCEGKYDPKNNPCEVCGVRRIATPAEQSTDKTAEKK